MVNFTLDTDAIHPGCVLKESNVLNTYSVYSSDDSIFYGAIKITPVPAHIDPVIEIFLYDAKTNSLAYIAPISFKEGEALGL